ncbi:MULTISPECIES: aminotransferase [Burkholderia]|uniref:Aminotransferase n=1 Tax=Burkholderia aenigmatica TaxID=2015348 RepID=A0A6J5IQE4_9BURK|nr:MULTISPECIES: aminotransferase [Burkholderia]MCA8294831.1 aminotransferase class III-fold pyridoxal phosphate-dependent enzyme [Burkholderia sp. AU30198]CAB3961621.1 aminotransferase [Burkholderia aenigmatica]
MEHTSLRSRDVAYQIHPHTNFGAHESSGPMVIASGRGIFVTDESGREYLEGMSGLWCTNLGFSEPRLADAAARQFARLPYYQNFANKATEPAIALAENLIRHAPAPMSKVLFQSSGSEANDTAMKLVWYYHHGIGKPDKRKIVSRQRSYHGTSVATGSLTGLPHIHRDFNLPIPGIVHVACPHFYRGAEPGETEDDYAARLADELEQTILREGPDTVGGFIAEPVMGTGGVVVPPRGYFERVQAVLRKYDVLFIVDEVICGMGRTGHWWGADAYALQPDMLVSAKGLSSAYLPISALLINERVYAVLKEQTAKIGLFGHGYTYGGHPVCAAVANEVFDIYRERDVIGHAKRVGDYFQRALRKRADHPLVGEARGLGLMGALELVADKTTRAPFPAERKMAATVSARAQDALLNVRPLGDAICIAPPVIITEAEIDLLFERLDTALDQAAASR